VHDSLRKLIPAYARHRIADDPSFSASECEECLDRSVLALHAERRKLLVWSAIVGFGEQVGEVRSELIGGHAVELSDVAGAQECGELIEIVVITTPSFLAEVACGYVAEKGLYGAV
jgi:hypothetical protein